MFGRVSFSHGRGLAAITGATDGGQGMLLRGGVIILTGALLSGCANNPPIASSFAPPAQAAEVDRDPSKKTLASKVLSAIALERVTGRKPDPARLTELN